MKKNSIRKALHLLSSKIDSISLRKSLGNENLIHQIINDIKHSHWTDEERKSLNKIKSLGDFYSSNSNEIHIKDFGFGSSEDKRTEEQMKQGVDKTSIISNIYASASSSDKEGEFMFKIIQAYKLSKCFELGTCLGISAAYGIEALRLNGSNGSFITFEGASELASLTESTLTKFSFSNFTVVEGRFEDTLPQHIAKHNDINFVFIDGNHEEQATIEYFELFYSSLSQTAILIFDDINWSEGMRKAWKTIKKDERIVWTVDNYFRGICYIDKENKRKKKNYKVWF